MKTIILVLYFSTLNPSGKWVRDYQVEFGASGAENACSLILKDQRATLGKDPRKRFEGFFCREIP